MRNSISNQLFTMLLLANVSLIILVFACNWFVCHAKIVLNAYNFYTLKSITNLAYDELIMKIVQSLFIRKFVHFTQISCVENMFNIQINVLMNEVWTYKWTNVTQILHLPIDLCFKYVFNARYQCVKCTNYERTNFAHSILSHEMLNLWCHTCEELDIYSGMQYMWLVLGNNSFLRG
jgi:hypothetical protein